MAQMNFDGENLDVGIGRVEGVDINRRKLYIVMNKKTEAPATTSTRPVATKQCIVSKRRVIMMRTQFSFLETANLNIVFNEERR